MQTQQSGTTAWAALPAPLWQGSLILGERVVEVAAEAGKSLVALRSLFLHASDLVASEVREEQGGWRLVVEAFVDSLAIDMEATVYAQPSDGEASGSEPTHSVIVLRHLSWTDIVRFDHLSTAVAVRLRDQGLDVAGIRTSSEKLAPVPASAHGLDDYFQAEELFSDEEEEVVEQMPGCCEAAKTGSVHPAADLAGITKLTVSAGRWIPAIGMQGWTSDKGSGLSEEGRQVALLAQCAAAVARNMWTAA